MKTLITRTLTNSLKMLMLVMVLSACGQSTESNSDSNKPKAPKIDLHAVTISGNLDAVKQHIAAGSDLNVADPFGGSSPLITAALFGKTEIAKALIDAGADINFTNKEGSTALITASFFGREDIVKLLLEKGADKTIVNQYGSTAMASVTAPFEDVKGVYQMMETQLGPMGLSIDYAKLEASRPVIAELLK